MPNREKCQACRESKVLCSRDGRSWNEQDPDTKCSQCKRKNLCCGPDEFVKRNDPEEQQRAEAADIRGVQLLAPVPNGPSYILADLRRRLREFGNSEVFQITRQTISLGSYDILRNFVVPGQLLHALEDIEKAADLAHASNEVSDVEVAYTRLVDWYIALGPEVSQPRQKLLMKVGYFYETTGLNDQAELYYLKIFDDILVRDEDFNVPFHHAIRNFNTKGQVGQDALMCIIRCCPLCRFKLRNTEQETPLSLAVSTADECVVVAIMKRLKDPRRQFGIDACHLDARDCYGLTTLAKAVLAKRSLPLIDTLIKHGSNVNPQTSPNGPLTPLQAATYPGYECINVAWLLIRHGANRKDICPGSTITMHMIDGLPEPAYTPLLLEPDQPPD